MTSTKSWQLEPKRVAQSVCTDKINIKDDTVSAFMKTTKLFILWHN